MSYVQLDHFPSSRTRRQIYIRGIGVNDPDRTHGQYRLDCGDGGPQYFSTGALVDLPGYFPDRVLRGPQGTLFVPTRQEAHQRHFGAPDTVRGDGEVTPGQLQRVTPRARSPLPCRTACRPIQRVASPGGRIRTISSRRPMGDQSLNLFRASLKWRPTGGFRCHLDLQNTTDRQRIGPEINGAVAG